MLKTIGNIYAQTEEEMENMHEVLSNAGYDFAYITVSTGGCFNQFPALIGKL